MKIINRKKLVAVGFGLAAFGTTVASAATLGGVTSQSVGSDTAVVASCDTDGVSIAYINTYSATLGAYEVSGVTVSEIDGACAGQAIEVTVFDASNVALASGSITVWGSENRAAREDSLTSGEQTVPISAGALSSAVAGAAVVISG